MCAYRGPSVLTHSSLMTSKLDLAAHGFISSLSSTTELLVHLGKAVNSTVAKSNSIHVSLICLTSHSVDDFG